jgi:hypothetical protein
MTTKTGKITYKIYLGLDTTPALLEYLSHSIFILLIALLTAAAEQSQI